MMIAGHYEPPKNTTKVRFWGLMCSADVGGALFPSTIVDEEERENEI